MLGMDPIGYRSIGEVQSSAPSIAIIPIIMHHLTQQGNS